MQWIGGPTFLLELGSFKLLADPVFGQGDDALTVTQPDGGEVTVGRRVALPELDLAGIDAVVICCDREDHVDATALQRLDKSLMCVLPAGGASRVAKNGFQKIEELGWGQSIEQKKNSEALTIDAVPTTQPDRNGYVFVYSDGEAAHTVYWTGATSWFNESRDIKDRIGRLDLFIPHLGAVGGAVTGRRTLDSKDAMQFLFMFQPKRIVPVGYHTFSHYEEPVEEFREKVALTMYDRRLVVLEEGETFERT